MTPDERQQLSDEIAILHGWEWNRYVEKWIHQNLPDQYAHPFPVGCLTSIAKALPDKWQWKDVTWNWYGSKVIASAAFTGDGPLTIKKGRGPDEWTARAMCVREALKKSKENK